MTDKQKLHKLRCKAEEILEHYGYSEHPVEFEDLIELVNLVLKLTREEAR